MCLLVSSVVGNNCSGGDIRILSEDYVVVLMKCLRNPVLSHPCMHKEIPGLSAVSNECEKCSLSVLEGSNMECFSTCLSGSESAECQSCWPGMDSKWRSTCIDKQPIVAPVFAFSQSKHAAGRFQIPVLLIVLISSLYYYECKMFLL